jgi:hypothetical protein
MCRISIYRTLDWAIASQPAKPGRWCLVLHTTNHGQLVSMHLPKKQARFCTITGSQRTCNLTRESGNLLMGCSCPSLPDQSPPSRVHSL